MREGFTFIIELKTLQNHADRAVALLDRGYKWNYKYLTCTLQGQFSAFDGRVNAVKIWGWVVGHKGSILKHHLLDSAVCSSLGSYTDHLCSLKSIIMVSNTPGTE